MNNKEDRPLRRCRVCVAWLRTTRAFVKVRDDDAMCLAMRTIEAPAGQLLSLTNRSPQMLSSPVASQHFASPRQPCRPRTHLATRKPRGRRGVKRLAPRCLHTRWSDLAHLFKGTDITAAQERRRVVVGFTRGRSQNEGSTSKEVNKAKQWKTWFYHRAAGGGRP